MSHAQSSSSAGAVLAPEFVVEVGEFWRIVDLRDVLLLAARWVPESDACRRLVSSAPRIGGMPIAKGVNVSIFPLTSPANWMTVGGGYKSRRLTADPHALARLVQDRPGLLVDRVLACAWPIQSEVYAALRFFLRDGQVQCTLRHGFDMWESVHMTGIRVGG